MKITFAVFVLLMALVGGGAADAEPGPVLDEGGGLLLANRSYYIIPVPAPPSGGLELLSMRKNQCPLDVITVQEDPSLPTRFIPINYNKKGVIPLSTDLNIVFTYAAAKQKRCPHYNVWKIGDYDNSTGKWFVTTGGVVGNPGRETVRNWFKIEKFEDAFKLVYCPSVCSDCKVTCKDIGTYIDKQGYEHLVLSDVPYKIQFM